MRVAPLPSHKRILNLPVDPFLQGSSVYITLFLGLNSKPCIEHDSLGDSQASEVMGLAKAGCLIGRRVVGCAQSSLGFRVSRHLSRGAIGDV